MKRIRGKRPWLLTLVGVLVVAMLAACGSDTTPEGTPEDGPKQGGVITMAVAASPTSWEMRKADWPSWNCVQFRYDKLLWADAEENLHPWLVTEWDVSEDGLVYTFKLRDDVKFHDGEPFNAEAVKFNLGERLAPEDHRYHFMYDKIASIDVVDEYTLVVTLKQLDVYFIYDLASWGALQVSPKAFRELGDDFGSNPIGTGPFKLKAYEPDSHIEYVRNEDYWGGAPLLDGVMVRVIPEPSVQVLEMQAGNIDLMHTVQAKDAGTLEEAGIVVNKFASPGSKFVSMNVAKGHTAEWAIRRAIAHAIDRDTIIDEMLYGYGAKSRAGVPEISPYYHGEIDMIPYDPEKAGEILDEAGWIMGDDGVRYRDGEPLVLDILSTDFSTYGQFNEILQEQLRRVGMDSEIRTLEWGAYLDKWRSEGDFEMTYHSQGSSFHSTAVIPAAWNPSNYWHIHHVRESKDPELMEVSEELEALNQEILHTLDFDKRYELAGEVQQIIQEHQLVVWLWQTQSLAAYQPYVKDIELVEGGRVPDLRKAWIDK